MEIMRCVKPSFCVIGKEGSTEQGEGFIQRLWADANRDYAQIAPLAKLDEGGNPVGFWGAMSDMSRSCQPWEEGFTKGLYLAGVEAEPGARPPEGWVQWIIPAYEFLYVKVEGDVPSIFGAMLEYLHAHGLVLAGAVNDFINPSENGQAYMYFPIHIL